MSVDRVVLTAADEHYAPPEKEIEVAIVGELVFITVFDCPENKPRVKESEVPTLRTHDLIAALATFGAHVQGVLVTSGAESLGGKP